MFHSCRSLEKNIQLLTSSVTPFGVPPMNQGIVATGNDNDYKFAARSTTPKGKAYLPDKREMAVVPDSATAKLIGMFWFLQQAY